MAFTGMVHLIEERGILHAVASIRSGGVANEVKACNFVWKAEQKVIRNRPSSEVTCKRCIAALKRADETGCLPGKKGK